MVRVSPLWLALVLSTLAFAGCIDDEPAPVQADPDVGVITDPGDFSYLKNQTEPGSHVHDYWNGQDVRRVIEDTRECGSCSASYSGSETGASLGRFRPAPDSIVPQGAAWLHINVTWDIESGSYGDIALYVKTAQQAEPQFVTLLEQGLTVTINSTNDDNDPPHHRLSLWEFVVRAHPPAGSDDTEIQNWAAYLTVDAERGLPIPVYPPHPDLWNGATEIVLHDSARDVQLDYETPTSHTCYGCFGTHDPDDGKIVPYDASRVEVTVEVPAGVPLPLRLLYHGADTWDHTSDAPVTDEPLKRVWHLDVADRPDSPYAKQSLWSFRVEKDQDTPVQAWSGNYHITVKVVK